MRGKMISVLVSIVFLSSFNLAYAQVVLNEFVSDPDSGSEWIELKNTSSDSVDLSGWNWTELSTPNTDTEHESSPKNLSGTISAGGVLAIDISNVLNNNGDSIGLYNGSDLIDRVSFGDIKNYSADLSKPAKGKAGALIGAGWQTDQTPTKGAQNPSSGGGNNEEGGNDENDNDSDENNDSADSSGSSSGSSASTSTTASGKITLEMSVRNVGYEGIPLAFQGKVMQGGQQVFKGRYFWNFGDGDFREVKVINTDKFSHTYFYPGDYQVAFEYYADSFAEEPTATKEINIKIIDPRVSIIRVGDATDFFVELANNTNYEVDISGWHIVSGSKNFTIPKNTFIAVNKKMIIPGRTSGLTLSDLPGLRLTSPEGESVFEYFTYTPTISTKKSSNRPTAGTQENISAQNTDEDTSLSPEELGVALAYAGASDGSRDWHVFFWPAIFAIFICIAGAGVYLIRRQKSASSTGDDFELLDE